MTILHLQELFRSRMVLPNVIKGNGKGDLHKYNMVNYIAISLYSI